MGSRHSSHACCSVVVKHMDCEAKITWVQIPFLILTRLILNKLLNISVLQFPCLQNGNISYPYFIRSLGELNMLIFIKIINVWYRRQYYVSAS